MPPGVIPAPPDLTAFVAGLSSAWRGGEVKPTFSVSAKPRYLRGLRSVERQDVAPMPASSVALAAISQPVAPPTPSHVHVKIVPERPKLICAGSGNGTFHAITMVWPLVCRRLEGCPNINSSQLFEELCTQFPGRFNPW